MCLTVPRKVTKVEKDKALLQDGRWVKTDLVGKLKVGDMILVNANLAIEKITKKQAQLMKQTIINKT
jgi:hydrogenase assembly chaperone HypC/HupF